MADYKKIVVDPKFSFSAPGTPVLFNDSIAGRTELDLSPNETATFTVAGTSTWTFDVQNMSDLILPAEGYLEFKVTHGGAGTPLLCAEMDALFAGVYCRIGGTTVKNETNHHVLRRLKMYSEATKEDMRKARPLGWFYHDTYETIANSRARTRASQIYRDTSDTLANSLAKVVQVRVPLKNLVEMFEDYSRPFIGTTFHLKLTAAPFASVYDSANVTTSITLSAPKLILPSVKLSDPAREKFYASIQALQKQGLPQYVPYRHYEVHSIAVANGATSISSLVPIPNYRPSHLVIGMQNALALNVDNSKFVANAVTSLQIQINGARVLVPTPYETSFGTDDDAAIWDGARPFQDFTRHMGKSKRGNCLVDYFNWLNSPVWTIDLTNMPSGTFDPKSSSNQVLVSANLTAAAAGTMYVMAICDRVGQVGFGSGDRMSYIDHVAQP